MASAKGMPRLQVKSLRNYKYANDADHRPPSLISNSTSSGDESTVAGTPPERESHLSMRALKKNTVIDSSAHKRHHSHLDPHASASVSSQPRIIARRIPLFLQEPYISNALVKGKLKNIAQCPVGVDNNEWIAVQLVDFYQQLNNFYSIIFSVCTCESMRVSSGFDLFWRDQRQRPAFTYSDSTLSWVETLMKNQSVFPTQQGRDFAPEFTTIAQRIYVQLLMLFAHVYHAHFVDLVHMECESHWNSLSAHYITFGLINDLLEPDAREINISSRKGVTLGNLVKKWAEMGIIPANLLRKKRGTEVDDARESQMKDNSV